MADIIYPDATGPEPTITNALINKYGFDNVLWLDLMTGDSGGTIAYLFGEHNINKQSNSQQSLVNYLQSKAKINHYFLDYSPQGNNINPKPNSTNDTNAKAINNLVDDSHKDYQSARKKRLIIDFSYIWNDNGKLKGLKHTAFRRTMHNKGNGEWCSSQIHKRKTWNGPFGAIAYKRMVSAAEDLNIDFSMAIVNSVGKAGTPIVIDGNAYKFPLNKSQIDILTRKGRITNGTFSSYADFLANL